MSLKIVSMLALLAAGALLLGSCYATKKTLLFENRVHRWQVYFVKEEHFSAGPRRYFEVYYKGQKLSLPKEVTDGKREVSEFISAVAADSRTSHFGTVIVIFEGDFKTDEGVPYRTFVTLHIRPGRGNDLVVTNPCNGKEAILALEAGGI